MNSQMSQDLPATIEHEIEVVKAAAAQYELLRQSMWDGPPASTPAPVDSELHADALRVLDEIMQQPAQQQGIGGGVSGALLFDPDTVMDTLTRRANFLHELQAQLSRDPSLLGFVDSIVSNHVQVAEQRQQATFRTTLEEQAQKYEATLAQQKIESERASRQQNRFSILVTIISSIISLAIGWLISAVHPSALLHLVFR